jgi:hypothetical protein
MQGKGIEVEQVYFSGFYSQGDGACFEGSINDLKLFLDQHYKPEEKPALRAAAELDDFYLSFTSKHTGHYYHYNSVSFNMETADPDELVNLAAKARLTLVVSIRFVQNETDNERSLERIQAEEECRIFEESKQREELADHLREWMGHDPYAEDFPWDDIPAFLWENLGIDLEDTPDLCDSLRMEGERRRVDPNAVPVGEYLPDP